MSAREDEMDVLLQDDDGQPVLVVGRERSRAGRGHMVRIHVNDVALLLGPRMALAFSEKLHRYSMAILGEQALVPSAASEARH